jgi:hypothetical protein
MSTPVTTFDERYSDPAAAATGWEETRRVFAHAKGDPFGATTHRLRHS